MIDILIIIIIFIVLILFRIYNQIEAINIIINGLLISVVCVYIALNTTSPLISETFVYLSVISTLLIPLLIIIKYIEKL